MTKIVTLGEVTCPSGELVLMDGGYLGLWSGERAPEEQRHDGFPPAVDFEIVGVDADVAARSFDRQCGRTLYDIPEIRPACPRRAAKALVPDPAAPQTVKQPPRTSRTAPTTDTYRSP